jgi:hypothetical protein
MKYRQRKRRLHPDTAILIRQISIGVLFFSFLALVLAGIWYGTRIESLNIKTVTVSGGETISHDEVKARVEAQLTGTYLRLIPKRFVYLYPHEDIVTAVSGTERIRSVTVATINNTELLVTFDEYISDGLWCKKNGDECVFVDSAGYAFAKAPQLTGGAFVRFFTTGKDPEVGQFIGSPEDYAWLKTFNGLLASDKWIVSTIEIDSAKDAYFTIASGGEFKVSLTVTPEETMNNLRTVLSNEDFSDVAPGDFQYIDLRFGNKVFVNRSEEIATSTDISVMAKSALEPQAPEVTEEESEGGVDSESVDLSASTTDEEL